MSSAPGRRLGLLLAACVLAVASAATADDVRVMTSGALAAPYLQLVAPFERSTGHRVVTLTTSTGVGADSIASRVRRKEPVDVVILPSAAIDELSTEGLIARDSRVALARSAIGMAVRAGAARPDISTVEGLTRTLLAAKSIGISAQVSGVYVSTELLPRLGIADEVKAKLVRAERERVGFVVARGEVEIGFQQISELLPIPGIAYVGPLPAEVQRVTTVSAGVATASRSPDAARELIRFLASAEAARVMKEGGLEPLVGR
jgi:molybdate transport system substrate-binding protein